MFTIYPHIKEFNKKNGTLKEIKISSVNVNCFQEEILIKELNSIFKKVDVSKNASLFFEKDNSLKEEEYQLILDDPLVIKASSSKGIFYGIQTLKQLTRFNDIPCGVIHDYPDLEVRAVMIDISRSKVPSLNTLKKMVDDFASLKYNHLELYIEGFSYDYKSFKELTSINNNYITFQDVKALEEYANERFIDLVPNQNGFGHMADWLAVEKYHNLAESPDGAVYWGSKRAPSTLDPLDEGSVELVKKMYADMLPYFKSKYFNMNFDEPMELGMGKTKEIVEKEGIAKVYLDFFKKLYEEVKSYNKIPMLWGDVLIKHPLVMDDIPKDIIFLDWGYDHKYDFDAHAKMLSEHNIPFMMVPGSATWATITGKYQDMYTSIVNAASAAKKYHGKGLVITDWGDFGHLQYLPSSYPAFVLSACVAWGDFDESELESALDIYMPGLSKDIIKLSQTIELEGSYSGYGCRMFSPIQFAELANQYEDKTSFFVEKMKYNLIDNYHEELIHKYLENINSNLNNNNSLEARELRNAILILNTLTTFNGKLRDHLKGNKINYLNVLDDLNKYQAEHEVLWCERNVKAGFKLSNKRVENFKQIVTDLNRRESL